MTDPHMAGVPLIWLNGCFGSGKTTTALTLAQRYPNLLVFDPEDIGFLLWRIDPSLRSQDFRDLRAWRRLVVETACAMIAERRRPLVAPMSLFDPAHLTDVLGGMRAAGVDVHHIHLQVSEAELRQRIGAQTMSPDPATDEGIRQWRLGQLAAGLAAFASPGHDAVTVPTKGLSPHQVAQHIAGQLPPAARQWLTGQ